MIELALEALAHCAALPNERPSIRDERGLYAGRILCLRDAIEVRDRTDRFAFRIERRGSSTVVLGPDGRTRFEIR